MSSQFDPAAPEHLRIAPIEPDKKKEYIEIPFKRKTISSDDLTKLNLLALLQNYVKRFFKTDEEPLAKNLFSTLKHVKNLLETLAKEDMSQNYSFADDLSRHWHLIIRNVAEDSKNRRATPYLKPLQKWIEEIDTYPTATDHSLGYYLTRFAGERWLPFPFMEILQSLHEDALLHKEKSTLYGWIGTLTTLLGSLSQQLL